jgi:hypothetical protein
MGLCVHSLRATAATNALAPVIQACRRYVSVPQPLKGVRDRAILATLLYHGIRREAVLAKGRISEQYSDRPRPDPSADQGDRSDCSSLAEKEPLRHRSDVLLVPGNPQYSLRPPDCR